MTATTETVDLAPLRSRSRGYWVVADCWNVVRRGLTHYQRQPVNIASHFARADDQGRLIVEAIENARREFANRHAGNRNATFRQPSFAPHAFRNTKRFLEQGPRQRPLGPVLERDLVRLFHLADDLRLAEHHAVEARNDFKKMPHRVRARLG